MDLSFLIDTNVAIQFEEVGPDGKIRAPFQQLHELLVRYRLPFRYHPLSEEDISNDKDQSRAKGMLSRLRKYPVLENPPLSSGELLEKTFGGIAKANDLIDCQLLFAITRNCATYLISEDEKLHRRARNSGLDERVLYVQEAADLLARKFEPQTVQFPQVNHEHVYNLDLAKPFFDSLKQDYAGFENWIAKGAREGRRCWTVMIGDELAGLCIYKLDDQQEHKGIPLPSIKLCTFKVAPEFEGRKLGELLIKTALSFAVANNLQAMWVTAHERQEKLIAWLKTYGFQVHADLKGKDMVFYKLMVPPKDVPKDNPLLFHILYAPHTVDDLHVTKFIIPIKPHFHDILFPEIAPQPTLQGIMRDQSIPGNTIRKVYLSHSRIRELPPGSLIFFYRSSPAKHISTVGIVEKARRLTDMESLAAAIGKRSVYSREEVAEMLKKEVLVINFRWVKHLPEPVPVDLLLKKKVFNNHPPQTIMSIDEKQYARLKALCK